MVEKRRSIAARRQQVQNTSLKEVIRDTINEYNRYRSPEATARLLKINNNHIIVEFTGSFCLTCGLIDWIEDLAYILEDKGLPVKLVDIKASEDTCTWKHAGIFKLIHGEDNV